MPPLTQDATDNKEKSIAEAPEKVHSTATSRPPEYAENRDFVAKEVQILEKRQLDPNFQHEQGDTLKDATQVTNTETPGYQSGLADDSPYEEVRSAVRNTDD